MTKEQIARKAMEKIRWYKCKVVKVEDYLGAGFNKVAPVYAKKSHNDKVVVFNNSFASDLFNTKILVAFKILLRYFFPFAAR